MGEGIIHSITPWSAPWCGWMMLALMLCSVLAELFQPGVITQSLTSLQTRADRTYKESPNTFLGQLFIAFFRIGTIGMALCMCLYTDTRFSFGLYAAVCGVVLAVLLAKMLCNLLIDYTFVITRRTESPFEHFGNIITIATIVLYVALLFMMRYGTPQLTLWVLGGVAGLFILMWLYRSWLLFVHTPRAVLYLLLYVATLDVLPIAGLYYLSEQTISIL